MPRRARGAFRFNAKAVGLTYSCPTNANDNPIDSCEELKGLIAAAAGFIDKYVISEELHSSGTRHYHAYFKFNETIDTRSSRFFDVKGVHPNVINKPGKGWIAYVKKMGNFISNEEKNNWTEAMAMSTVEAAVDHLWQTETQAMCKSGNMIASNIASRMAVPPAPKLFYGPFPLWMHEKLIDWDPTESSLLLTGPPGQGKTQFARYIMAHQYGQYNFVKKNHEDLKDLPNIKLPLLFDEVNFHHREPDESKEITDVENGGSIHCRFKSVTIPPGVPRIFLSNEPTPFHDPHGAVYQRQPPRVIARTFHIPSDTEAADTHPAN